MSSDPFIDLYYPPGDFPVLDLGQRCGITDYIDFISLSEATHPVMRGVDCYRRPFITIRGTMIDKDGGKHAFFQTVFQRYTSEPGCIMICGHGGNSLFCSVGGMRLEQRKFLHKLVSKKTVKVEPKDAYEEPYRFELPNIVQVDLDTDVVTV